MVGPGKTSWTAGIAFRIEWTIFRRQKNNTQIWSSQSEFHGHQREGMVTSGNLSVVLAPSLFLNLYEVQQIICCGTFTLLYWAGKKMTHHGMVFNIWSGKWSGKGRAGWSLFLPLSCILIGRIIAVEYVSYPLLAITGRHPTTSIVPPPSHIDIVTYSLFALQTINIHHTRSLHQLPPLLQNQLQAGEVCFHLVWL